MSDLSDYQTHVWNPLEKSLRATIAAQREEITLLRSQVSSAVDGAQPLWSGEVHRLRSIMADSESVLSDVVKYFGMWEGRTANQDYALEHAQILLERIRDKGVIVSS